MTRERFLVVKQPWASLIMAGLKDVENRPNAVPSTLPQWRRCPSTTGRIDPISAGCSACVPDGPFPFRLWIHAGKGWDRSWAWECVGEPPVHEHRMMHPEHGELPRLRPAPWSDDLRGVLLGHVTVTGCHHASKCFDLVPADGHGPPMASRWCSPWAQPDTFHWTVESPVSLPEPIPLKGMLGLPFMPDVVLAAALSQLEGVTAHG